MLELPCNAGEVSDGDHTFTELYKHRCLLYLAFLALTKKGWFSTMHSDGSKYDGWFLAGVTLPSGQISYHLPNEYLEVAAMHLVQLQRGLPWDGHTSTEVLERLKSWMLDGAPPLPHAIY